MIVADTNVIAYLWIPGEHTLLIEKVLEKDQEWAAPLLWRSEFMSVLFGYIRIKKIDKPLALKTILAAIEFMKNREYLLLTEKVLNLVHESNCSAYDCEYVALAQDLGVPLVSMDKKLIQTFPKIVVSAGEFIKGE